MIYEIYSQNHIWKKYIQKKNLDFIGEIIKSKEPYIFIFIKNIGTSYSNINKTLKERKNNLFEKEQISNKINQVKKTTILNDKNWKNNETKKEIKKSDNKMLEINTTNGNKKINNVDSERKKAK